MAEVLNRCIWPENNEGNEITQWVLKINLQVDPRRSLLRLQPDELSSDIEIEKQYAFDAQIKISHGNSFTVPVKDHTPNPQDWWDEEDLPIPIPEVDAVDEKGTPISPNWIADTLIDAKVFLPRGESDNLAKVIQCYLDVDWQVIGNHNEDLILNTCIYGVEFQDGIIKPYAASLIAQKYPEPSWLWRLPLSIVRKNFRILQGWKCSWERRSIYDDEVRKLSASKDNNWLEIPCQLERWLRKSGCHWNCWNNQTLFK